LFAHLYIIIYLIIFVSVLMFSMELPVYEVDSSSNYF